MIQVLCYPKLIVCHFVRPSFHPSYGFVQSMPVFSKPFKIWLQMLRMTTYSCVWLQNTRAITPFEPYPSNTKVIALIIFPAEVLSGSCLSQCFIYFYQTNKTNTKCKNNYPSHSHSKFIELCVFFFSERFWSDHTMCTLKPISFIFERPIQIDE